MAEIVKTGIKNVKGAVALVILLLSFGGIVSLTVWQQDVPRRESLASESATLVGFETRRSRYSSYEYLLVRINGRDERLLLSACVSELKRLPPQTNIDVLRVESTLFEVTQAGTVACSYAASVQALAKFQTSSRVVVGSALGVAVFLVALLAWTRWRIARHLDKLALARRSPG